MLLGLSQLFFQGASVFYFLFIYLSIYFSFIFISWRLITLQHCSGFCHTLTWISHEFTCIPHPSPPSISWMQSPSAVILQPPKIKSVTVCTVSPSICHEVRGPGVMIFVFWKLSFKPTSSLFSFTFIKRLFSSSLLSAIGVVSSAYLRLIFFLAILLPACASSNPRFHMMYSAYKLNKQSDDIQHWSTPFPSLDPVCCSVSGSNCCFSSFIHISQEAGKVVWYSHFWKNFPQFVVICSQRL